MSSQARSNPGQVANTASDCAEKHEEDEDATSRNADGHNGGQFDVGVGGEHAEAAGSSERRDRVPSLQPPMAAFKVASLSQERNCHTLRRPHVVSLLPSVSVDPSLTECLPQSQRKALLSLTYYEFEFGSSALQYFC